MKDKYFYLIMGSIWLILFKIDLTGWHTIWGIGSILFNLVGIGFFSVEISFIKNKLK